MLCGAAYAPALGIPLLEDDYPNITLAQSYGGLQGLPQLMHDAVFRLRATSCWVMLPLWKMFGLTPWGYHAVSLALHVLNTWMVYALALLWTPMRRAAQWAAVLFAVHEGHQEALMWFSAINELLLFSCGVGALLCWLAAERGRTWLWQTGGVLLFALALLSKESAIVLLPLFWLAAPARPWRERLVSLLPYLVLGLAAALSIWASRSQSFRFSDGSFSWHAPFWITWPRGVARLLWPWGWLAASTILLWPSLRALTRPAALAVLWSAIALAPYSFLTYSTQIPSRQTYLASAGLALLFGLAFDGFRSRPEIRRPAAAVVLIVVVAANCGYLWTKKRRQFLDRAEPTEQLIRLARRTQGPILMRCFPRQHLTAEAAVQLGAGKPPSTLIWPESADGTRPPAAEFCYQ